MGEEVTLHYFRGRGRAETTRWMLAANEIPFRNVALANKAEFDALKATGKLLFNQLPLLEIDGLHLTQTTALLRYLARRGDFYGDDDLEAVRIDMVAGAVADFNETAITFAFHPTHESGRAALEATLAKYGPRLAAIVDDNASGYVVGTRMSFADVVLADALTSYLEYAPDILDPFPQLQALRERVVDHPGIAAYLASENRWPVPGDQYVIDVARVLARALPAHMPDPDRFVE